MAALEKIEVPIEIAGIDVAPMLPWWRQKTVWTIITGMVTAAAGYFTGEVSLVVFVGIIFGGLTSIFARQGIEKSKNPSLLRPSKRGDGDITG